VRSRRARPRLATLEVDASRPAEPRPSWAEDHARRQAERLEAKRRRAQHLRELVAAIEVGEAAYRRLCDRLDDFDERLKAVRRTLNATPADRPAVGAARDRTEVFVVDRSRLRGTPGCMVYRPCGSIQP
jgi:hypothetical protein